MNTNASSQSLISRIEKLIQAEDWNNAKTYVEHLLDQDPENGYVYFLRMLAQRKVKTDEEIIATGRSVTADENYPYIQLFGSSDLVDRVDAIEKQIVQNEEINKKKEIYQQAEDHIKTNTVESVTKAVECLRKIPGWKDADSKIPTLLLRIKDLKYEEAVRRMNSDDFEEMVKAIEEFKDIANWKDSESKIPECEEKIQVKRDGIFNEALSKLESKKITEIENGLDEIKDLQYIVNKLNLGNGDYSEYIQKGEASIKEIRSKRMNIGKRVAAGIVGLCIAVGGGLFGEYMKNNHEYTGAIALAEAKQYGEAYEIFSNKGFFKDSIDRKAMIQQEAFVSQIAAYQTTNIPFGQYNGKDIKWIVLKVEDNTALLVSEQVLDRAPYNTEDKDVPFEETSIYKVLNEGLYNDLFTDKEKSIILDTVIEKPEEDTETEDQKDQQADSQETKEITAKMFLLSSEELEQYVNDGNFKAKNLEGKGSNYWLKDREVVTAKGEIDSTNALAKQDKGLRPAIWIDLELE